MVTELADLEALAPTALPPPTAVPVTWEERQKHAGFYQTQVSAIQQAALAFNTTAMLVITLAVESYLLRYPGDKARSRRSVTWRPSPTSVVTPAPGNVRQKRP